MIIKKVHIEVNLNIVKIIETPHGTFLKRTQPKYLVKKIPPESIIDLDKEKNIANIEFDIKYFKQEGIYRFLDMNIEGN
jgi:hypothetical protein